MAKKNLLIIISTDNVESMMKFPLLYGGVSIPRGYWEKFILCFGAHQSKKLKQI